MKKTKAFYLVVVLAVSVLLLSVVNAQAVSEEARRHMDRGQAAVEMAKAPEDYAPAIKEFEQAIMVAPDWPDVYYNLGMVQEKAGKYSDAITSLKQYLRLAPNASDAETVKSLINKLEFKAEQVLTPKDYAEIFVSLYKKSDWVQVGSTSNSLFQGHAPTLVGENLVRVETRYRPPKRDSMGDSIINYDVIKIDGNKIRYKWIVYRCHLDDHFSECPLECDFEIEIVSRNLVKVNVKTISGISGGTRYKDGTVIRQTIENDSYEYVRK